MATLRVQNSCTKSCDVTLSMFKVQSMMLFEIEPVLLQFLLQLSKSIQKQIPFFINTLTQHAPVAPVPIQILVLLPETHFGKTYLDHIVH